MENVAKEVSEMRKCHLQELEMLERSHRKDSKDKYKEIGIIHVQVQCLLDKLEEREKAYLDLKKAVVSKKDKYKGLFEDY